MSTSVLANPAYIDQLGQTLTDYAKEVLGWVNCPGLRVSRVYSQRNMFRVTVHGTQIKRLIDAFCAEAMIRGEFDPTFMLDGLRADWDRERRAQVMFIGGSDHGNMQGARIWLEESATISNYWGGVKTPEQLAYEKQHREDVREARRVYEEAQRIKQEQRLAELTRQAEEAEVKPVTQRRRRVKAA